MAKVELPRPLFDTLTHHFEQAASMQNYPFADDYRLANEFIYSYRNNTATFNAYRREVERLLQWSAHIIHQPLKN